MSVQLPFGFSVYLFFPRPWDMGWDPLRIKFSKEEDRRREAFLVFMAYSEGLVVFMGPSLQCGSYISSDAPLRKLMFLSPADINFI